MAVELDEGAKGVEGSWVDKDLVVRMGLTTRPIGMDARFTSRLFPGQEFVPREEVDLRLRFEPAGIEVTLSCRVLPRNVDNSRRSDVIIGDYHLKKFGIRDLMQAEGPVYKPARAAQEVYESLGNQFLEMDLLEDSNLFGAFSVVNSEPAADEWGTQVCTQNFPVGSRERDSILELLREFPDVIV